MRRAQDAALRLFRAHGFNAVTVEQVAQAAGVAPVSLYRWFGTKEGLVLWDDYDPELFAAITARLEAGQEPLAAVRDAVVQELGRIYDADRGVVLARTQLIHREPALLAAATANLRSLQDALAGLFSAARAGRDDLARRVLAAVAVGVLAVSIEAWQEHDGHTPLASLVQGAFAALGVHDGRADHPGR